MTLRGGIRLAAFLRNKNPLDFQLYGIVCSNVKNIFGDAKRIQNLYIGKIIIANRLGLCYDSI